MFIMPEQHSSIMEGAGNVVTFQRKRRSVLGVFRQALTTHKQIRSFDPDIVFFHSTFSLLLLFIFYPFRGEKKFIYCPHGWAAEQYAPGMKRDIVSFLEGRLCGFSDLVINISENDMIFAKQRSYSGHHIVIENAVPPPLGGLPITTKSKEESGVHLLFVGRFDRQKGIDILLDSFKKARAVRHDLSLTVIGAAVRGELNVGEVDGVRFIGWVDAKNIDRWYAEADALVVPSRWEGFGLVIPEAMRNGTPSLVARRSGMHNRILEGVTGFSFHLDVKNLTELLVGLEANELRSMRDDCIALYESRFHMDRLFDELDMVYDYLVGDVAHLSYESSATRG